jgi:hypothetical protein
VQGPDYYGTLLHIHSFIHSSLVNITLLVHSIWSKKSSSNQIIGVFIFYVNISDLIFWQISLVDLEYIYVVYNL